MSSAHVAAARILRQMTVEGRGFRDVFYAQEGKIAPSLRKQVFALALKSSQDAPRIKRALIDSGILPEEAFLVSRPTWSRGRSSVVANPAREADTTGQLRWTKKCLQQRGPQPTVNARGNDVDPFLCLVSAWDLLKRGRSVGSHTRRSRAGGGAVMKLLKKHEATLLKCLSEGGASEEDTKPHQPAVGPRYIRLNASRISMRDALADFSRIVSSLPERHRSVDPTHSCLPVLDPDLPQLLAVYCNVFFSALMASPASIVFDGRAVIQDKASCVSALAARVGPGQVVVDCCSAPGSKAIHCIDLMQSNGRLILIEKCGKRAKTLVDRVRLCMQPDAIEWRDGVSIRENESLPLSSNLKTPVVVMIKHGVTSGTKLSVEIWVADFLQITPVLLSTETPSAPQIDVILLDPSCSGSGLPSHERSSKPSDRRLRALAEFQQKMLRHALETFKPQRLAYSTCSVHVRENEEVVSRVLETLTSSFPLSERPQPKRGARTKKWKEKELTHQYAIIPHGVTWSRWTASREAERSRTYLAEHIETCSLCRGSVSSRADSAGDICRVADDYYAKCFHSHPDIDECRGFFLALIERSAAPVMGD